MYTEDDLIPISALQHLVFCARQAALIHIEGLWEENVLTIEGEQLHERAHDQESETTGDTRTVRGLRIRSLRLGLIGVADVVEFRRTDAPGKGAVLNGVLGLWQPYIIEYKHGKPKIDRSDEVQLCAQAMCLEEMLGVSIEESAFFYGKPRRRQAAAIGADLRRGTEEVAARAHQLLQSGKTPAPEYSQKCRQCSLIDRCLPKTAGAPKKVQRYVKSLFAPEVET
jgi:CRISPR-associated exonuclease Cas4